jgi:hypothetical protein
MDQKPPALGYEFAPCRYGPHVGYARLRVVLSASPSGRYFDVRALHLPTFDGRSLHQTEIVSHPAAAPEALPVCLGPLSLESHRGEMLHAFSFGGALHTLPAGPETPAEILVELSSSAPLIRLPDDPAGDPADISSLFVEEVLAMLAEKQAGLAGHEEELYARLAACDPYRVFLSCLVSLEERVERVPPHLQLEGHAQVKTGLHKAIQAVRSADGWDGRAPRLEELLGE